MTEARFYVVQNGDTLSAIGDRLGIDWRRLSVTPRPEDKRRRSDDLIYPGDLVKLPEGDA